MGSPSGPPAPDRQTQATPDTRTEAPRGALGDTSTAAEKQRYKSQLQKWCEAQHAATELVEGPSNEAHPGTKRLPNKYYMHALYRAMMSWIGRPLADFVPLRKLGKLSEGQRRYFVDDSTLRHGGEQGRRRSCIWDSVTNKGFVEQPREYDDSEERLRGELVIALDQGSVGHQAMFWLYTKVRL